MCTVGISFHAKPASEIRILQLKNRELITDSFEKNTYELPKSYLLSSEVLYSIEPEKSMDTLNSEDVSSSWSFVTEYDLAKESRLLNFDNASNEKLINPTCYKLDYDDEGKYIEIGYSTYLELTPVIRIWNSLEYNGVSSTNGTNGPHNVHCNDQEKNNVLLTIDEWKVLMGLQDHLMNEFFYNSVNDEYQELVDINDGLVESISSNISKDREGLMPQRLSPKWSDAKTPIAKTD
ncbi:hypothetical protein FQR65_LT02220 [Abscondita terminalis]|nr:hypothetical protein FQR65_LT02220 [Abscondita terminalis]